MNRKIEVVVNSCYGGFRLSDEAMRRYTEIAGVECPEDYDIARHDPYLVQVVKELGSQRAGGAFSDLTIVEVQGERYRIDEHDGAEVVETPDTIDWVVVSDADI